MLTVASLGPPVRIHVRHLRSAQTSGAEFLRRLAQRLRSRIRMTNTAADVLIETIQDWGVDVIFGLPGDGINGIMEALRRRQESIRFVQVRHEESAAFMACAYAKYTGKLGVCVATSGPGGLHLLNGLYDAKLDGQPVMAFTGHHIHDLIGTYAQQYVDLDRIYANVAVYS